MNTQDKSKKLAELMGWERIWSSVREEYHVNGSYMELVMYDSDNDGLAQFAAILLKFPEVFEDCIGGGFILETSHEGAGYLQPTQANILDEILRMNGIDIEAMSEEEL